MIRRTMHRVLVCIVIFDMYRNIVHTFCSQCWLCVKAAVASKEIYYAAAAQQHPLLLSESTRDHLQNCQEFLCCKSITVLSLSTRWFFKYTASMSQHTNLRIPLPCA